MGSLEEEKATSMYAAPNPTAKNGARRSRSSAVTRPHCHQCQINSAAGRVTTMDLQSSPSTNSASAER